VPRFYVANDSGALARRSYNLRLPHGWPGNVRTNRTGSSLSVDLTTFGIYLTIQLVKMVKSSSKPTATPKRSAETRAGILAAAATVFAECGLAGARTEAIATAAGVNKALLYYYFRSKERLYEAVVEDHFREFNRQALQVLAAPGRAQVILLQYVSLHFDFISARRRYARLYQQMMVSGGRPLERLVRKYFIPRSQAFGKLLERGMHEGEFRHVEAMHAAISIVALIVFYFSAAPVLQALGHADAYSAANLERRKAEVLDFIRHGLFRDPGISRL
jgi:TetR/AcrR family transcriptional regulator